LHEPSEIDDLLLHDSEPDERWTGGEIELAESRPTTALAGDPRHRKWMLLGVGVCGLLTALAVVLLTHETKPARAAETHEPESPAVIVPAADEDAEAEDAEAEVAKAEVAPSDERALAPASKPTLAATTAGAAAPVQPVATPSSGSGSGSAASVPAASAPAASAPAASAPAASAPAASAPKPDDSKLPVPDASSNTGAAVELPDVEGWDAADEAVEAQTSESGSKAEPEPEPPGALVDAA
jgi:hypothetical protein